MILPSFRRIIPSVGPTVIPGSASWTTPGTYTFTIPAYRTFNYDVRGAGGGGQGAQGITMSGPTPVGNPGGAGGTGGLSQVYLQQNSGLLNVYSYGGAGGNNAAAGAGGTAGGGDQNITGGGAPGGAGGVMSGGDPTIYGGAGGYGGRAIRTHQRGITLMGQTLVIIVGSGGPPGANGANSSPFNFQQTSGTYGANGAVYISWS